MERLEYQDRVRVWSPADSDYFKDVPAGFSALVFTGFMAADLLLEALYDVRPVETRPGQAQRLHDHYFAELLQLLQRQRDLSLPASLLEIGSGRLFGVADLLRRAGRDLSAIKGPTVKPTVLVVGEIYVRCDPFANDFIIDKLEARGLRCRFAPFNEWIEYTDKINYVEGIKGGAADRVNSTLQSRIQESTYRIVAKALNWPKRTTVEQTLHAAEPYMRPALTGEAVLTLGGPIHEWREGHIDGVVSVGPLECMPNKISEAQFFHVAEREGLPSMTLALNGDPMDAEVVDNFAFEVHTRYRDRQSVPTTSQAWLERTRRQVEQTLRQVTRGLGRRPTPAPLRVEFEDRSPAPLTRDSVLAQHGGNGTKGRQPFANEATRSTRSKPGAEA